MVGACLQANCLILIGHSVPSYVYYGQEKTPTELTIGVLGVKAWRWPTFTWGDPTLSSAMLRFTSEFGMGSGGSTALLSSNKLARVDYWCINNRCKFFWIIFSLRLNQSKQSSLILLFTAFIATVICLHGCRYADMSGTYIRRSVLALYSQASRAISTG
jgi:hypothetical protein